MNKSVIINEIDISNINNIKDKYCNIMLSIKLTDIKRLKMLTKVNQLSNELQIIYKEIISKKIQINEFYDPILKTNIYYMFPRFTFIHVKRLFNENNIKVIKKSISFNESNEFNENNDLTNFQTELWTEKQELISNIYENLIANEGVTFELNTGLGKTVILSKIISLFNMKTVIFVTSKYLQKQMLNDVMQHLNLTRKQVRLVGGYEKHGKKLREDDNAKLWIVISKSGLIKLQKDKNFWSLFSLSIYDECHSYCSKNYKLLLRQCQTKYKLALSASVKKYWNWKEIIYNCGNFIDGNKYIKTKPLPATVEVIQYSGPKQYTQQIKNKNTNMVSSSSMSKQFLSDPYRTNLCINVIIKELHNGHKIICFSDILSVVNVFYNIFSYLIKTNHILLDGLSEIKLGILTGIQSEKQIEKYKNNANLIFTTYKYSSEGINIPRMTCSCYLTSFRNNGIQISGRVLRGNDDSIIRKFIDIIDTKTSIASRFIDRRKVWDIRGYQQDMINIDYLDIELTINAEILDNYIQKYSHKKNNISDINKPVELINI